MTVITARLLRLIGVGLLIASNSYSFTWNDLWATQDQQGQALMKQGQFKKAEATFRQPAWRASAAYRAGDYQKAAQLFGDLQTEEGYYNQANALAHLGKYEEAIHAYNKALEANVANKDARYNRHILEELLKKQKENQAKSQQDKKSQHDNQKNNQNQKNDQSSKQTNQQSQHDESSDANQTNSQSKKNQSHSQSQSKQDNNLPKEQSTNQRDEQQRKQGNQTQQNPQKDNNKPEQTTQNNQPSTSNKMQLTKQANSEQTAKEREKKQAKERWLRLIPDDPGGLLREKFLRDYIRRQQGWYQ